MSAIKKELNEAQKARAIQIAEAALKGFAAKFSAKNGREPTQDEAKAFAGRVAESALNSVHKSDPAADKAKRVNDTKAVNELAALHGVKFVHRRDLEEEVVDSATSGFCDHGYTEHNRINYVNATRGGNTIAFKYVLDDKNNLFIEYATAFCRPDENFDPLIGKQEALKKFLAGEVISTQITHEPFGPVKLDQLVSRYKVVAAAAKAAQPK